MAWLNQFSLVMRSSITNLREKIEDPERMMHQLIIDMEEELLLVRSNVADAIADEIQMRKRSEREKDQVSKWMERASTAVKRGDDQSARSALDQKLAAEERAQAYALAHGKQQIEVFKLQNALRDLEDKIRQAKQKMTLLTARLARAKSTQKINGALNRADNQSAYAQFTRFEQRVDREEALCDAWDRLDGKDVDAAEIERKFKASERQEQLAAELESLKSQITGN